MKKSENKRPSESFILGAVALVFLMIGYQVAMFVYRSAVTKIAANRDEPDTVFVYQQQVSPTSEEEMNLAESNPGSEYRSGVKTTRTIVRKNSEHSKYAQAVRENLPRTKVESFRFDPNTASEDEFCRLGFSSKQAKSIINYRNKGGRFRRKSDFAKSYVVSDTIYKRLESYIDIPLLDLNTADSAAFDALPGIGGWFANKIIEHRDALKGYSYKEQLMDVWRMDEEKYSALQDLVTINPQTVTPYPLWSYPVDSLRKHPYIANYETARAIVLYRESTPVCDWSIKKLSAAGVLSESAADKLSRCYIAAP